MAAPSRAAPLVCPRCRTALWRDSTGLACAACGVAFPVSEGIADFSGGVYYDVFPGPEVLSQENRRGLENESDAARIEGYYLAILDRAAAEQGRERGNMRVLDSGCGNGESVDVLARLGFEAWGHDLSALRKWQWRVREHPERLVVSDGAALPFPDGYFDAVIASGVLEHIGVSEEGGARYRVRPRPDRDDRRREYLAELVRVLAPAGRLYLDFPNGDFPIDFWHGVAPGGARFHSRREGFLPTVRQIRRLCRAIDPGLVVSVVSPEGRLRFRQVSGHWYGRAFRLPMAALHRSMSIPGLRFLAGLPINPYLVLETRRSRRVPDDGTRAPGNTRP